MLCTYHLHILIGLSQRRRLVKLSKVNEGFCGVIKNVDGDYRLVSRVTSIGLTEGSGIEVMRNEKRQPILVYSRDSLIAINRKDCEGIEVE